MTPTAARPLHAAGAAAHDGFGAHDGHVLRCADCGRVVPCTLDDILWFSDAGWPRCCDEVMSLDTPAGFAH